MTKPCCLHGRWWWRLDCLMRSRERVLYLSWLLRWVLLGLMRLNLGQWALSNPPLGRSINLCLIPDVCILSLLSKVIMSHHLLWCIVLLLRRSEQCAYEGWCWSCLGMSCPNRASARSTYPGIDRRSHFCSQFDLSCDRSPHAHGEIVSMGN